MSIRLRGHHLLCVLTYIGKGYSPAFVRGLDAVCERINTGEAVLLVMGADDICAPWLQEATPQAPAHCHNTSCTERDAKALHDISALLQRPLQVGEQLQLDAKTVQQLRNAFAQQSIRSACMGCEWQRLCTQVAVNDRYADVKLMPKSIALWR